MKKIICYLGDDDSTVYADAKGSWFLGTVDATGNHPVEVVGESGNESDCKNIAVQLATSGMSAEDIVKLKHGGVI